MTARQKFIATLIAFFLITGSFWAGMKVQADVASPQPGSADDPLISKSYADAQIAALKSQITALQSQVSSLETRIAALEAGKTSGTTTTPPATGNTGGTTTTPSTGSSTSGSKVVPRSGITSINVRQAASLTSPVIGSITASKPGTFLGQSGSWYQVKLSDGKVGWVSNTVGAIAAAGTSTTTPTATKKVYPRTGNTYANVRGTPALTGNVIGTVTAAAPGTYLGVQQNGWYKVELTGGKVGWVSNTAAVLK